MADKKGIFRSPGNIVFNAQTISERADELRVADDSIIVNYDRTGATASLKLYGNTSPQEATITFDGTSLTTSAPITNVLTVSNATNAFGNISYNGSTLSFQGVTESEIHGVFSATDAGGDGSFSYSNGVYTYTGPSASETRLHFSAGTGLEYNNVSGIYSITNSGVSATSYGSATAIPTFTVNAQGQLTAAADVNIAIPASQITDFSEAVDDRANALIVAGTGITKDYDDAAGSLVFDLDNTAVAAGEYGSATTIPTYTVNAQGQLTAAANVLIAIPHSQITDFDTEVKLLVGGTPGQITYSSASGVFGLPATITQATDFSGGLTASGNIDANDNSTKVATTAWVTSNAPVLTVNTQSGTVVLDTDDIAEGSTNQYFTTARSNVAFDDRLEDKTTSNLAEGSNLYYTDARARAAFVQGSGIIINSGTIQANVDVMRTNTAGTQTVTKETDFTGILKVPTLPLPSNDISSNAYIAGDSGGSVKAASTAYVEAAITAVTTKLVDGAPGTLDTLNEISAALNDDASLSTTLTNSIATKAPLSRNINTGAGLTGGGNLNSDLN